MTDPRAALAEALSFTNDPVEVPSADFVADHLAERGVLLVTEDDLAKALCLQRSHRMPYPNKPCNGHRNEAKAVLARMAALSGEATEPLPWATADDSPSIVKRLSGEATE